jgi:hypothetical protein
MNRVLAVGLMMVTVGCGADAPDLGPPTITAHLSVEPRTVPIGGSTTITLTLTHSGNGSTVFSVFEDGHSFNPVVKDASGSVVWTANAGRALNPARKEIVLTNGQVYVATVVWNLNSSAGDPLPAGSYTVTSTLDAEGLAGALADITTQVVINPGG